MRSPILGVVILAGALVVPQRVHAAAKPTVRQQMTQVIQRLAREHVVGGPDMPALAPAGVADTASRTASALPSGVNASALRLPDSAFTGAGIIAGEDGIITPAQADSQTPMRADHWWSYTRLGMTTGYFEAAKGVSPDDNTKSVYLYWQATVFPTSSLAYRAYTDGVSRAGQGYSGNNACAGGIQYPCSIFVYASDQGNAVGYIDFQIGSCIGETGLVTTPDVVQNHTDLVARTMVNMQLAGAKLLKQNCVGTSGGATTTVSNTSSPQSQPSTLTEVQAGFKGSCYTFRGDEWGWAEVASKLIDLWWTSLQDAYGNNYPVPTGGSVPGPTDAQVAAAQQAMAFIHRQIHNRRAQTGAELDVVGIAYQHGITSPTQPGAASWAVNRLFGTLYYLDKAANEEYKAYNTGLDDYHTAQGYMSNTWDALKQLQCQS